MSCGGCGCYGNPSFHWIAYLPDAASFNLLLLKMYRFLCAGKGDAAALYLPSKTQKSTLSEVLQP